MLKVLGGIQVLKVAVLNAYGRVGFDWAHTERARVCPTIGRKHKSHFAFLEANFLTETFSLECWDPDCKRQRAAGNAQVHALPAALCGHQRLFQAAAPAPANAPAASAGPAASDLSPHVPGMEPPDASADPAATAIPATACNAAGAAATAAPGRTQSPAMPTTTSAAAALEAPIASGVPAVMAFSMAAPTAASTAHAAVARAPLADRAPGAAATAATSQSKAGGAGQERAPASPARLTTAPLATAGQGVALAGSMVALGSAAGVAVSPAQAAASARVGVHATTSTPRTDTAPQPSTMSAGRDGMCRSHEKTGVQCNVEHSAELAAKGSTAAECKSKPASSAAGGAIRAAGAASVSEQPPAKRLCDLSQQSACEHNTAVSPTVRTAEPGAGNACAQAQDAAAASGVRYNPMASEPCQI